MGISISIRIDINMGIKIGKNKRSGSIKNIVDPLRKINSCLLTEDDRMTG